MGLVSALTIGIVDPVCENRLVHLGRALLNGLTGAGGSYGFFSPNIGNQVLVHFQFEDGRTLRLHELVPAEVALRLGNMYRLFVDTYGNEKLKRSVAASLTAQMFRRFSDAKQITFVASVYQFPSLAEAHSGGAAKTVELYRIKFEARAMARNQHASN